MRKNLWCILALLFPVLILAQPTSSPLQVGIGLMGVSYEGDLTDAETAFQRIHPGGNISVQFDGKAFIQPQFNVGFGEFREQSDFMKLSNTPDVIPNSFVSTSFFYTDLRLRGRFMRTKAIQPVLGAGIGLIFFNPKDQDGNYLGENIFTRLSEEQYNTTVPSFVGTAGLTARINATVSAAIEYNYRMVNSDYLDNIGLLGTRSGNDKLHSLEVSMRFTLWPPKKAPKQLPQEPETPPVDQETIVEVTAETPNQEIESRDLPVKQYLPPSRISLTPTVVQAPRIVMPKAPTVEKNWPAIEASAIAQRKFVYYPVKEEDTFAFIVEHFHLQAVNLQQLNHLINEEIYPGTFLRLPDMDIPFP